MNGMKSERVFFDANQHGFVALIITLLIWGTTFLVTKVALQEIGPLQLTVLRFALAFLVLAPLAARQGFKLRTSFGLPSCSLAHRYGVVLFLAKPGVEPHLDQQCILILSIVPVITAVLAVIFLKESLTKLRILGIGLVTIGMILVALNSSAAPMGVTPGWGISSSSPAGWPGLSTPFKAQDGRKLPGAGDDCGSTGAGLIFLLPFAGWETVTVDYHI